MTGITVEELAQQLCGNVRGDRQLIIHGAQAVAKAGPHDVTFLGESHNVRELQHSNAGAVIIGNKQADQLNDEWMPPAVILVDDAQAAFIRVLQHYRPQRCPSHIGISPGAVIASTAKIGEHPSIYPGAFIDDDVTVGNNCTIYPNVYVGPGCRIGDDVCLYPNVVLYAEVAVGNRVTVHASAVVGADGFGYRFEDGRYQKIPQLGTVRVEDDVEIGACTTIDRGMIGPTVIGEGTKLDNLVMIAHNCELGDHNAFASQVGLAGSVVTGDYVRCGGQVGISGHVHLGKGCSLGAKTGVHKDVPAGEVYMGVPAGPRDEQIRRAMALNKLPEMRRKLRELEKQVAELTARLPAAGPQDSEP